MKKIIILFFVLLITILAKAQESEIKHNPFTYSLKSLWNIDSCGELGYRWEIVKRLCSYDVFKGKDTAFIQNLLGKPDTIYFYESRKIVLVFSVLKLKHDDCCCETILHDEASKELHITVNKKGKVNVCEVSTDTFSLKKEY